MVVDAVAQSIQSPLPTVRTDPRELGVKDNRPGC